jgi:hypothetical protein
MNEIPDGIDGELRLVSEKSFPVWSIVHYLNRLSTTYLKLLTIDRVCEALAEGCLDQDLIVAEQSAKLITTEPFVHEIDAQYKTLANKGENYEEFWKIIKSHHRPIVFRRNGNEFSPLINVSTDDLIIKKLTVTSPPDITVTGVGSTLTDLYYAGEREERRQEHTNMQIGQTARNIGDIASAHAMLNNHNMKPGMKAYLETLIFGLVESQDKLNKEMGMTPENINETA